MAPRRRIEGPIGDQVRALAIEHPSWSPGQVYREVVASHEGRPAVSLRTVQRIVRTVRAEQAPQDLWTMLDGDPEDAALVLQVLTTYLGRRWPTMAEADFVVRVRRAFPDIPPDLLARLGPTALSGSRGLREVTEYLAHTPWRDGGEAVSAAKLRPSLVDTILASRGNEFVRFADRLAAFRKDVEP